MSRQGNHRSSISPDILVDSNSAEKITKGNTDARREQAEKKRKEKHQIDKKKKGSSTLRILIDEGWIGTSEQMLQFGFAVKGSQFNPPKLGRGEVLSEKASFLHVIADGLDLLIESINENFEASRPIKTNDRHKNRNGIVDREEFLKFLGMLFYMWGPRNTPEKGSAYRDDACKKEAEGAEVFPKKPVLERNRFKAIRGKINFDRFTLQKFISKFNNSMSNIFYNSNWYCYDETVFPYSGKDAKAERLWNKTSKPGGPGLLVYLLNSRLNNSDQIFCLRIGIAGLDVGHGTDAAVKHLKQHLEYTSEKQLFCLDSGFSADVLFQEFKNDSRAHFIISLANNQVLKYRDVVKIMEGPPLLKTAFHFTSFNRFTGLSIQLSRVKNKRDAPAITNFFSSPLRLKASISAQDSLISQDLAQKLQDIPDFWKDVFNIPKAEDCINFLIKEYHFDPRFQNGRFYIPSERDLRKMTVPKLQDALETDVVFPKKSLNKSELLELAIDHFRAKRNNTPVIDNLPIDLEKEDLNDSDFVANGDSESEDEICEDNNLQEENGNSTSRDEEIQSAPESISNYNNIPVSKIRGDQKRGEGKVNELYMTMWNWVDQYDRVWYSFKQLPAATNYSSIAVQGILRQYLINAFALWTEWNCCKMGLTKKSGFKSDSFSNFVRNLIKQLWNTN